MLTVVNKMTQVPIAPITMEEGRRALEFHSVGVSNFCNGLVSGVRGFNIMKIARPISPAPPNAFAYGQAVRFTVR
jgi:hypothetical protein